MYSIMYSKQFWNDVDRVDIEKAEKIVRRIDEYLSKDPINLGKPLTGGYRECYRYRYGDYRIIYKVLKQEKIIRILGVMHRKEAYR